MMNQVSTLTQKTAKLEAEITTLNTLNKDLQTQIDNGSCLRWFYYNSV